MSTQPAPRRPALRWTARAIDGAGLVGFAYLAVIGFLVLFPAVPLAWGFRPVVIESGSMSPHIERGDIVVLKPTHEPVKVGAIVTVRDATRRSGLVTHRVFEVDADHSFLTKGDANAQPDSDRVAVRDVVGVGRVLVPSIGIVALWWREGDFGPLAMFGLTVLVAAIAWRAALRPMAAPRAGPRRRRRAGRAVSGAAALLALAALLPHAAPRASAAAFTKTTSNATNSLGATSNLDDHSSRVLAAGAGLAWRMSEASGAFQDYTGNGRTAVLSASGLTRQVAGAISSDSDTATAFNGTTGCALVSLLEASQTTFSWEIWFKTTTTTGGYLVQFTDNSTATATASNYDRMLYMTDAGTLKWGFWTTSAQQITTAGAYNDGAWHQVIGTAGGGFLSLTVDGTLLSTLAVPGFTQGINGWWRIGCGIGTGWPSAPTSNYFNGTIDEVAMYPRVLSTAEITTLSTASTSARRSYPSSVLVDSPWTYERLNDTSGSTLVDLSGNARHASVSAGVTRPVNGAVAADANAATKFNGTTGCGANTTSTTVQTSMTIELWFKSTSASGGVLSQIADTSATTAAATSMNDNVYLTNAGAIVFGVNSGSQNTITANGPYNDGNWHQVAAAIGAGGMVLYVDGAQAGTNANTSSTSFTGYYKTGCGTVTGWPSAPTSSYLSGTIDEFAVYHAKLSATRVKAHYAAAVAKRTAFASSVVPSSPWGWWRLADSSGNAVDSSGNGRTASVSGSGVTRSVTGVVTNPANAAYTLDGAAGCAVSAASATNPTVFTLELWFKTTTSSGGGLVGLNSVGAPSNAAASADRTIYMTNAGTLVFGNTTATATTTASAYNDGAWHHVAATYDNDGYALYVDGAVVASGTGAAPTNFTGYWKFGCGYHAGWPSAPTSEYFAGTVDEVAVYTSVLSPSTIADHARDYAW